MNRSLTVMILCLLAAASAAADDFQSALSDNWHQWRGPLGSGLAPGGDPPVEWSLTKNIEWKLEVPGRGSASPIVWGDRLYLLSAIETDREGKSSSGSDHRAVQRTNHYQRLMLYEVDRTTGKIVRETLAIEALPEEGHHKDHGYASASPTTDGERIYASFGSMGIFGFDMDGKKLWDRDLGQMTTRNSFGEGSSPVVRDGRLVIQWDHEGQSFITALDGRTGETLWKADRDEISCWATPLITEHEGRTLVITNGSKRVRCYDLADGKLLWECGGQTTNAIPSPVVADGVTYVMSGFRGSAAYAIPLGARGDLTDSARGIVWHHEGDTPYVPSPLLYDDLLYFLKGNNGILTVLDRKSGDLVSGPSRLDGPRQLYSSPVGAAGRVYIFSREGIGLVLRHGREFEMLATNDLEETIDATPAIVGSRLYVRGERHLFSIAEKK